MKKFILLTIFLVTMNLYAQNAPIIRLKDSSQLKLSTLKVDVKNCGQTLLQPLMI